MLKIGAVIAVPLAVGFIAFPQFRTAILGLAPFAILALCPLGMIFGMKGMTGDGKAERSCTSCDHEQHKKMNPATEKADK